MSELNLDIAPQIAEACRTGAGDIAEALSRALGPTFDVALGQSGSYDTATTLVDLEGPGLALLLDQGGQGLAIVIAEASGLLPSWYVRPDATGESKLATLAQELGMLVVPETLAFQSTKAGHVPDIAAALQRTGAATGATTLTLNASTGEGGSGRVILIWPLSNPSELFTAPPAACDSTSEATSSQAAGPAGGVDETIAAPTTHRPRVRDLRQLPGYARSLLKIRVPVCVQLAAKKELVQEVITLAPGSIIKFEKGCEELLQMIVGEHTVAEGEAVKIGEKFGFRVTSLLLPPEHFVPAKKQPA